MKTFRKIVAVLAFTCAVAHPIAALAATPAPATVTPFGGAPTFVASNMTTNVTCGAAVLFRERPLTVVSAARTVTAAAAAQIVSWEFSTNRPNDTVTNWFRPPVPVTTTFTNNSVTTTNQQVVIIPASNFDNMVQARPWSFQNTGATNGWTNLLFSAVVIP
jgi:hypothetical protein